MKWRNYRYKLILSILNRLTLRFDALSTAIEAHSAMLDRLHTIVEQHDAQLQKPSGTAPGNGTVSFAAGSATTTS